jgi:hypothetical protein
VFPEEAKFEKVYQTQDRVYMLEMRETKQRFFYWMQVRVTKAFISLYRKMIRKKMRKMQKKCTTYSTISRRQVTRLMHLNLAELKLQVAPVLHRNDFFYSNLYFTNMLTFASLLLILSS